jgi:hypothetical protein
VTPAILPNWRSNGVAIEEAIISGLAPGNPAPTVIVGKSICGRGAIGRKKKATPPARAMATVRRAVATGRCMNGEDKLISQFRGFATLRAGINALSGPGNRTTIDTARMSPPDSLLRRFSISRSVNNSAFRVTPCFTVYMIGMRCDEVAFHQKASDLWGFVRSVRRLKETGRAFIFAARRTA